MKQRQIFFNDQEYKRQIPIFQEFVKIINDYNMSNPKYKIGIEDIKEINANINEFKTNKYLKELELICEQFGADFDTCKTFPNSIQAPYKMFVDMANKRCQPLFNVTKEVSKLRMKTSAKFAEYFSHDEGGVITFNQQKLKDALTDKTETEKENKLLDMALKLQSIIREFRDMGITRYDIENLFTYPDYHIRAIELKALAK